MQKKSACPPAQFELLPTSQSLTLKNRKRLQNPKVGLFSNEGQLQIIFSSDYAPWAKTRTTPLEKRIFELGISRRDCGLVPTSLWLMSSGYRFKTNMNAKKKKEKSNPIKSDPHKNGLKTTTTVFYSKKKKEYVCVSVLARIVLGVWQQEKRGAHCCAASRDRINL